MQRFRLVSPYQPTGDQPTAITALVHGVEKRLDAQTLLGVTGSGKTFTMANVIANLNRPTLVISHNKTLAAQLHAEFQAFFPHNAVEYFVSYYNYYQPEAYIPARDVYIEKELSINPELEKMRMKTFIELLSGRRDLIVIASVSCIYGLGNPDNSTGKILDFTIGEPLTADLFSETLATYFYKKSKKKANRCTFTHKGDTIEVGHPHKEEGYRIHFSDTAIDLIETIDLETRETIDTVTSGKIFPTTLFTTNKNTLEGIIHAIEIELNQRIRLFLQEGRLEEAKRIEDRTKLDIAMMREVGYCHGIENYSRFFDGRKPGARPFCLIDYFPKDMIVFIDESHVTIPQIKAMGGGNTARKKNLVHYGFRLPSALDNRPLDADEFESIPKQTIYVSATPADYEIEKSGGTIVEQLIRPTGLLDPTIEVHKTEHQIDHLLNAIHEAKAINGRSLVITLTKRMAEKLVVYLQSVGITAHYIHSDVKTLDRVRLLKELREGVYDVLVGVNLLREGLDLPEVSLVAIFDADKEGFLRNPRSLIQMIGRAARNLQGKVIMYADTITRSMDNAIQETNRRREMQETHNRRHNITPHAVKKGTNTLVGEVEDHSEKERRRHERITQEATLSDNELQKEITKLQRKVAKASKETEYMKAAVLQRELEELLQVQEKASKNSTQ